MLGMTRNGLGMGRNQIFFFSTRNESEFTRTPTIPLGSARTPIIPLGSARTPTIPLGSARNVWEGKVLKEANIGS